MRTRSSRSRSSTTSFTGRSRRCEACPATATSWRPCPPGVDMTEVDRGRLRRRHGRHQAGPRVPDRLGPGHRDDDRASWPRTRRFRAQRRRSPRAARASRRARRWSTRSTATGIDLAALSEQAPGPDHRPRRVSGRAQGPREAEDRPLHGRDAPFRPTRSASAEPPSATAARQPDRFCAMLHALAVNLGLPYQGAEPGAVPGDADPDPRRRPDHG